MFLDCENVPYLIAKWIQKLAGCSNQSLYFFLKINERLSSSPESRINTNTDTRTPQQGYAYKQSQIS